MASLNQILGDHPSLLLLDGSSATIQVGWLRRAGTDAWASCGQEAGVGLFRCLEDLGADPAAVDAFLFSEAPGSILGIRTCAVAIRTWCALRRRPAYAFFGLAAVARHIAEPGLRVIADARRGHWHSAGMDGTMERVPRESLGGALAMPEGFRCWDEPPAATRRVPYNLAELFADPAVRAADLFRPSEAPDAFQHAEPSYKAWVPQIHRAP